MAGLVYVMIGVLQIGGGMYFIQSGIELMPLEKATQYYLIIRLNFLIALMIGSLLIYLGTSLVAHGAKPMWARAAPPEPVRPAVEVPVVETPDAQWLPMKRWVEYNYPGRSKLDEGPDYASLTNTTHQVQVIARYLAQLSGDFKYLVITENLAADTPAEAAVPRTVFHMGTARRRAVVFLDEQRWRLLHSWPFADVSQ